MSLFDDEMVARQLKEIISKIYNDTALISGLISKTGKESLESSKQVKGEIQIQRLEGEKMADAIKRTVEENKKLVELNREETLEKKRLLDLTKAVEESEKKRQSAFKEFMHSTNYDLNPYTGKLGNSAQGVRQFITDTQSQVFSGLGTGGLFGLILWGLASNVAESTEVNKFTHKFRQISGVVQEEKNKITRMLAHTRTALNGVVSVDDLNAGRDAFLAGGFNSDQQTSPYESLLFKGLSGNTVLENAALFDKHYSLQSGTAASSITALALATNSTLPEATKQIERLAIAGGQVSTNFANMLGVFAQVTTAARFNAKEIDQQAQMYFKLYEAGKALGFSGQKSAKVGLEIFGETSQIDESMQYGLRALLGKKILQDKEIGLGAGEDPALAASWLIRTGWAGTSGKDNINTALELINQALAVAQQHAPGDSFTAKERRALLLDNMLDTKGKNTAHLLLALESKSGGNGIDLNKLPKQAQTDFGNIVENMKSQDPATLLGDIKNVLLSILKGILGFMQLLVSTLALIGQWLAGGDRSAAGDRIGYNAKQFMNYGTDIKNSVKAAITGGNELVKGLAGPNDFIYDINTPIPETVPTPTPDPNAIVIPPNNQYGKPAVVPSTGTSTQSTVGTVQLGKDVLRATVNSTVSFEYMGQRHTVAVEPASSLGE